MAALPRAAPPPSPEGEFSFVGNLLCVDFVNTEVARELLKDPRLQLVDAVLAGMPPVTLLTARIDPLRCDAQKLRDALASAQVQVEWRDFEGVTNGFFNAAAVVEKAREAHRYAAGRLAVALAESTPASGRARSPGLTRVFRQLVPDLRAASPERA